jgi:hypothetical protein
VEVSGSKSVANCGGSTYKFPMCFDRSLPFHVDVKSLATAAERQGAVTIEYYFIDPITGPNRPAVLSSVPTQKERPLTHDLVAKILRALAHVALDLRLTAAERDQHGERQQLPRF